MVLNDLDWPGDRQIFALPSGDLLSYARLGRIKDAGQVWILFHGTPCSRLGWSGVHRYAESHGIRVLAMDRPGYGHSTIHYRGILGFVEDVHHLVDYLRIPEFRIYSGSGGGTHALAAAYHFPKGRLKKTSIMCGAPHPDFKASSVSFRWKLKMWLRAWVPFWTPHADFG